MDRKPIKEMRSIVGEQNVLTDPEELHCYGYDASKLSGKADCVAFPRNTEEVSALMKLANRYKFPVFPRGAGSGMVGGAVPYDGGLVMALTRLNRILRIDQDNMLAVVQPGVVTGEFQKEVLRYGLFYPPDPASLQFSTLGGNVAMCSGGPKAVKYGVTRDYVIGLEVVLPTGQVMRTGTRTMKGVVGYDLTRLMVGSEGTLGIITEITLRLLSPPEAVRTLMVAFPRLESAAQSVCKILRGRALPSTLELMDQATIQVVENYMHMGLPSDAEALLLIEIDGRACILEEDTAEISKTCRENGASHVEIAQSAEQREKLWQARRAISPALGRIRPGKINEDVVVPRTEIPNLIRFVQDLARKHKLIIVCFGHAGDGNIHTNIMLDRQDPDELRRAERAVEELFHMVLRLGGTISGEHGIGIAKSPFFKLEVGAEAFDVMWRIKKTLDPLNLLNPGKMFIPNKAFFAGAKSSFPDQ